MDNMTLDEAIAASDGDTAVTNNIFLIDSESRTINVPPNGSILGVETDNGVERKYFKCPRIVGDNIDLSKHKIYVSYIKASNATGTTFVGEPDSYYCDDMAVDDTGDYITFSWCLSGNVLKAQGYIAYKVVAKHTDGDYSKTRWNTRPAIGTVYLTVPDGEPIEYKYPDIVTQLLDRMDAVEEIATVEAMQGYVDDYLGRNPVQLDSTLTDPEKAAPANVVGELRDDLDKLKWQSFDMKEYCTNHTMILINGRYAEENDNFRTSNPIKVSAGDTFVIYNSIGDFNELAKLALYDDETTQTCKEYVSFTSYDSIYTVSSNGYIRFSMYANDANAYLYKVDSIDGFSKELSNELDRVKKMSNSTTLSFNVSQSIGITSNKITTDIKKGETFCIKLDCDIESINNYQIWINDSFYTSSSVKNDWMTFTATKDIKTIHIVANENNVLKDTTVTLFVADKYSLIQFEDVSKNTFDIGKYSKVFRVYTNEYDFINDDMLNNLGLKNGDTIYVMIKSSNQSFGALQISGNGDYLFSISEINTFVKYKLNKDIDEIGIYISKSYISEAFTGELIVLANISKDIKHLNDEVQIMTKGEPFLNAYYTDEWKNSVISEINTSNEFINGVSFAFITDMHFEYNSKQSKYLLRYILNNTQVPFVICGGDFPSAYGDSNSLRECAKVLNEYQEYIGKNKFFCVRGNHDFTIKDNESSLTGTTLPSYFTYGNLIKNNEYVVPDILPNRMCYYIDNVGQRTRFVMVNSCDTQSEDATAPWGVNYSVSDEQIRWIVNNALNVDGYKIIFIMHIPFDIEVGNDGGTSQIEIGRIAQAINNKTVYTKGNITKDFSNTENEVICVISGHTHKDSSHIDNNVLSIGTTCDAYYTDDGHGAIKNTVTEQAFDIFSIDYDTRKIKATRVGRGNSREWTY